MSALLKKGVTIQLFDPIANEALASTLGNPEGLQLFDDPMLALDGSDGLLICTEWKVFKAPDFKTIKSKLSSPVIFDGRNLYDPKHMESLGIDYYAIGRGKSVNKV